MDSKSLKESFNKVIKVIKRKKKLEKEKAAMEELYKNDEVLGKYLKILEGLNNVQHDLKEANVYMYNEMLEADEKKLEDKQCTIILKKPYSKTIVDTKAFLEDNKPGSKLYKKYVSTQEVKGNITLNIIEE